MVTVSVRSRGRNHSWERDLEHPTRQNHLKVRLELPMTSIDRNEEVERGMSTRALLSYCVCSKCPPMLLVLIKQTDLAAHIMIGPSGGMASGLGLNE